MASLRDRPGAGGTHQALLTLYWQAKASAKAQPRAYTPELHQQKCELVFPPIEQAYPERDRSVDGV